jgi:putative mycofactocin binding protein MftB
VSTEPSVVAAVVDTAAVYRLAPSVSLRPERFGALAYSFDTRKLSFLKHPDLVAVVESLDGSRTVAEALEQAGVAPRRWPSFLSALGTLETSEMISPMEPDGAA